MSEIVLGMGTSHTPQLSSGWELWSDHANRDKGAPRCKFDTPERSGVLRLRPTRVE